MLRNAIQAATKLSRSRGTAQPASIPSSHLMNGRRHAAGASSERAAIAENEKSIGTFWSSIKRSRDPREPRLGFDSANPCHGLSVTGGGGETKTVAPHPWTANG